MIYIDTRYAYKVSKKSGKFNGGNNYTKNIILSLLESKIEIRLICNESIALLLKKEYKINDDSLEIVNNIENLFINNCIYFNPQIDDSYSYYREISCFKKKNPKSKIAITIHDRRHLSNLFDKYNGILNKGIKKNWIIFGIGRLLNGLYKDIIIKKIMSCSSKIYTVSNYSMQQLLSLYPKSNICYYNQKINYSNEYASTKKTNGNFILFVSAGRSEKNFIRALLAFKKYIEETNDDNIIIVATGLSQYQQSQLYSCKFFDNRFLGRYTKFYDYVSNNELQQLYDECRFLLFPSKSEGYGLPVAEALLHNKPSIASNKTSIPEASGNCSIYVNPYSIESIKEGISSLMNENIYSYLLSFVPKKREIFIKQMIIENELLINDIVSQ